MREKARHVPETVERFLESTLESVDNAEELAVGVAQRAGFNEDDLMKIGMAVRESMVNAVVHGNRYNANKKVRFSVMNKAERFTVRIADQGEGFEYEEVPDPLAPENLDDSAKLRDAVQTVTLLALRAVGVMDARARGLVVQATVPARTLVGA